MKYRWLDLLPLSGFGVERALAAGMERGMDWLLQMDPDELLYPQSEAFDITVGTLKNTCSCMMLSVF